MKKKVFISFDYENNKQYRYPLNAWNANQEFDFSFRDNTPDEIQSNNIPTIKAGLSRKINTSDCVLVIIGEEANKLHRDWKEIGYRNWQNFEIAKAKESKIPIVAVKINYTYESPSEILNSGAKWVYSFTTSEIMNAIRGV